ncbi:MAG TPA: hypothetical protein VFH17_02705 [Coriobacteriia bacterium]|nr:hypothetical protein [Coriobacteriia bacterium]
MDYWEYVAQVPQDGDSTYLDGSYPGAAFNVGAADVALAPGEKVVAVAAAVCWRSASAGIGRVTLRVGAVEQATANVSPSGAYDTVFVFTRTSPATSKSWTKAEVNAALVGAVVNTGYGLRATQAGLHVLLYTPPVVPLKPKEWPMNFKALESLTATGSDQAVEVPRGATLIVRPLAANVEVRDVSGATAKLTIPADSMVMLGPSYGQTVYLRATAGTVIELGLT